MNQRSRSVKNPEGQFIRWLTRPIFYVIVPNPQPNGMWIEGWQPISNGVSKTALYAVAAAQNLMCLCTPFNAKIEHNFLYREFEIKPPMPFIPDGRRQRLYVWVSDDQYTTSHHQILMYEHQQQLLEKLSQIQFSLLGYNLTAPLTFMFDRCHLEKQISQQQNVDGKVINR